jgi:hypothetical protein
MLVLTQEAMLKMASTEGIWEIDDILQSYPLKSGAYLGLVTLELKIQTGVTKLELSDIHISEDHKEEILEDYMRGVAVINILLQEMPDWKRDNLQELGVEIFTGVQKYIAEMS